MSNLEQLANDVYETLGNLIVDSNLDDDQTVALMYAVQDRIDEGLRAEQSETKSYKVNLPMIIDATSPAEAVHKYIEQVNRFGLRAWHYSVVFDEKAMSVTGTGEVDDEPEDVSAPEPTD